MRRLPRPDFFTPDAVKDRRREEAVARAVAETRDVLVVSHKNCLDGVGSYLIHALASDSTPPVVYAYPDDVHEVLEQVAGHAGKGRTLSVNDLSFQLDHTEAIIRALGLLDAQGWKVTWRDHHHKQWEDVDLGRIEKHLDHFRLDTEKKECGASLAQQDLLPNDPLAKELAAIVRDRDIWINEDPRSADYEAAVRHLGTEQFVTNFLATRDCDAAWIKAAADAARVESEAEVETAILAADIFGDNGELALVYGEVPKNITLHRIREHHGTRMEINLKPDGRFSVRSAPGTDVAHLVGQAYGGGGHPNAAGGKVRVPVWEWPLFWWKGGMSPSGMSVVKTALRLIREAGTGADGASSPPQKTTPTKRTKKASQTQGRSEPNGSAAVEHLHAVQ